MIHVFEGPIFGEKKLVGWRHYFVIFKGGKRSFLSHPDSALRTSAALKATFHPAGEWTPKDMEGCVC